MRALLHISLTAPLALGKTIDAYDYIILGGGTAGLVLANRLTEDPNVNVAVVEAGGSVKHNSNVTQIENFFINLGTDIDWQYISQPQRYANNQSVTYHSGKAFGGTSTINGATYMRAQKAQIDAWEQMGNTGWNWASLWPYYKQSEIFQPPTPSLVSRGAEFEACAHGYDGHVHVGWSNYITNNSMHKVLNQTLQNLHIPYNRDQSDGNVHGFSVWPSTILSRAGIRADAARNYLYAIQNRCNLHLFPNTIAEKILWSDEPSSQGDPVLASGVQVRPMAGGQARTLPVRREVIVSAGSLRSPAILEHSGIGNPHILSAMNIPVRVNLPGVGENLQDQPMITIEASSPSNWTGYTPFVTNPTASDLFGPSLASVAAHVSRQIPVYAAMIADQARNAVSVEAVEQQLRIQADLIFNQSVPCAEVISAPLSHALVMVMWILLPFSRGSVHIGSADASVPPRIDPNFFMLDWDAIAESATANFARKVVRTTPLSTHVGAEVVPNTTVVPENAGVQDWLPWFKKNFAPNYHPVGTCAMMSRAWGGVVDPELRVYGTENVRVVDGSVLPFQVDGHLTSTIYAVAERAADIIKGCST